EQVTQEVDDARVVYPRQLLDRLVDDQVRIDGFGEQHPVTRIDRPLRLLCRDSLSDREAAERCGQDLDGVDRTFFFSNTTSTEKEVIRIRLKLLEGLQIR